MANEPFSSIEEKAATMRGIVDELIASYDNEGKGLTAFIVALALACAQATRSRASTTYSIGSADARVALSDDDRQR